MEYRLDVVLHKYNFKTREDEAGSMKLNIHAGLDRHTQALKKTREPKVNIDLSSMVLSREKSKVFTQRQIHADTQWLICTKIHVHTDAYTYANRYRLVQMLSKKFMCICVNILIHKCTLRQKHMHTHSS
jgi:hypothetical protein